MEPRKKTRFKNRFLKVDTHQLSILQVVTTSLDLIVKTNYF